MNNMNELPTKANQVQPIDLAKVKRLFPRFEDLTGKTFSRLTCIEYLGDKFWLCRCSCGVVKRVHKKHLRSGSTTSCGCYLSEILPTFAARGADKRRKQLTGKRFGRLVVIRRVPSDRYTVWECLCDCGKLHEVEYGALVRGGTRSCGCLAREMTSLRMRTMPNPRTGKFSINKVTGTRLYGIWSGMKQRCNNPGSIAYPRYGGRGIIVCKEWSESFDVFKSDMGEPPSDDYSLERKDNDGPYAKWNCKWATSKEQQRNRYDNVKATVDGVTKTVSEWSEIIGIAGNLIANRIKKQWPHKIAVFSPTARGRRLRQRNDPRFDVSTAWSPSPDHVLGLDAHQYITKPV